MRRLQYIRNTKKGRDSHRSKQIILRNEETTNKQLEETRRDVDHKEVNTMKEEDEETIRDADCKEVETRK